ncbi:MAG: hypothetical protein IBJ10_05695 [Phycisphaerales bacterium]|nr:hypothetical protein [Phycisphaerales bacterium]
MSSLTLILWIAGCHLAAGLVGGGAFVWRGLDRIDDSAKGASRGVRLLLWPGAAALWPIVLLWWRRAQARGGPTPARPARGMRSLRLAHAIAWTITSAALAGGLLLALDRRAAVTEPAP